MQTVKGYDYEPHMGARWAALACIDLFNPYNGYSKRIWQSTKLHICITNLSWSLIQFRKNIKFIASFMARVLLHLYFNLKYSSKCKL